MVLEKALLNAPLPFLSLTASGHDANVQAPVVVIHLHGVCVGQRGCVHVRKRAVSHLLA